jgi:hypothetical protein
MKDEAEQSNRSTGYVGPFANTDRELWRDGDGDYYADSIHVTESGGIGINVGGRVLVAPVRLWHDAGMKLFTVDETLPRWRWRLAMWLLGWA